MWTIIEPNIAIICACLPMCRMPLQRMFPKLFPGTEERPTNNSFRYAGSGKNEWTPSSQQTSRSRNRDRLASVTAGMNNASEEYILHDRNLAQGEVDERALKNGGIQNTTHFSVRYEDAESVISGERSHGKVEPKFDFVP